eukprot:CAMPEP_0181078602 /NCGR_PEP_ID=MMETSP1071-20121207/1574_1 /TAXON_ID=35127 /ORGANISM="Thalassiosira sp., Strain NH16" /LENGTH=994 /DNA_ID=CAMNT_0023159929 /DNA_START=220 /DNA_END=3204 /DNA_ORIENTATION=-
MADGMSEVEYNPYAKNEKKRLAIIIPYLPPSDGAPTFPPYFDLFAMSAAGSAADIDYLIFHCFIPPSLLPNPDTLPSNVKLIDLNGQDSEGEHECGMAKLFTRVTDQRQTDNLMQTPLPRLISRLSKQIVNVPYILVEYKPAFGHIFADYLKEYSHWGYSDLDVVFGDMSRWIDEDEWNDYDIVTWGFGDQDKLYLRGQFTFHRNDPHINQIWRHCKYLSEMDIRYAHPDTLKFESAEGCYSQAVITKKDIKVKWAVKAFTDVGEDSPVYAQGVYFSLGSPPSLTSSKSYNPKSVLYTAATVDSGHQLLSLPYDWFEDKSKYPKYSEGHLPIQRYVGERTKVQTYRTLYENGDKKSADIKCMYWAPKTYQMDICTVDGDVESDEVVVLEKGALYKQKFVERKKLFPEGIKSFPFFHFQEWKRIYRTTELLPSHNIRHTNTMPGLIITKEGTLPLFSIASVSGWKFRNGAPWSSSLSSTWMSADTGSTLTRPTSNKFCLDSSPKGYPKAATVCTVSASWPQPGVDYASTSLDESTSLIILRSPAELSKTKTTVRGRKTDIKSMAWWDEKLIDANIDVTLTLTLQISSKHMKEKSIVRHLLALADTNIYMWGSRQPSVLLIHVDSSNEEEPHLLSQTIQTIKDTFGPNDTSSSPAHLRNSLVAILDSYEPTVSRKGLLNMATFAAPTRWIVSGLELERGLVLSKEASVYAMREARTYADMHGHVLVIPQFASTQDDTRDGKDMNKFPKNRLIFSSVGADLIPSIRSKQTMVSDLSKYDCGKCAKEDPDDEVDDATEHNRRRLTDVQSSFAGKNVEQLLEDLWFDLSVADVYGTPGGFDGEARTSLDTMAKVHDRIEVSLVSLLDMKSQHLEYLRYFDKSPILMTDRLGPKKEMMTLDLAPEVEDLRGKACFNLLRLAQLAALGYKITVLPGALAASYPSTREALCPESIHESSPLQCDCELDSEGTIKEILIDEVKRPAKVAVLMEELDSELLHLQ